MKEKKQWFVRIVSLLIMAVLFVFLNYIFTVVIGRSLTENILRNDKIANLVQIIRDSGVDYNKICIILRSEKPQPIFGFFIFAFFFNVFVVSVYTALLSITNKYCFRK